MTSTSQKVLDAIWEKAPMSVQDLVDHFRNEEKPLTHDRVRSVVEQLLNTGKITRHSMVPGSTQAWRYSPTGSRGCDLDTPKVIELIVRHYRNGQSFDQGQVAEDLCITHDAAKAALKEMRRTGLAVKTRKSDVKRSIACYRLDLRKAVVY